MSHEFKVIASKIMSIYSFGCAPKAQKMRPPEPREPLRATLKISPDQRAIFFWKWVPNGPKRISY